MKSEPKLVDDFMRAYVLALQRLKKDSAFAEKTFAKWLREKDPMLIKKTVEAYNKVFKLVPNVPDKGIDNVLKDLANRRTVPKEFFGRYEIYRDSGPLERALARP